MIAGPQSVYLAVLAQVMITVIVYVALAVAKARAVKAGAVDRQRAALHEDAWPESVIKINNNIRNQFQAPVLFYVVCLVLVGTGATGILVQVLAWLFVASRAVHAWVHTRSNYVPLRRRAFMLGVAILVALWVIAAWHVM